MAKSTLANDNGNYHKWQPCIEVASKVIKILPKGLNTFIHFIL